MNTKELTKIIKDLFNPLSIGVGAVFIDKIDNQGLTSREKESLAGELAAKEALAQVGCLEEKIQRSSSCRRPIFPEGFLGSVTHKGNIAISLATNDEKIEHIGIDLEFFQSSDERLVDTIVTAKEKELFNKGNHFHSNHFVTTIFSAKEATYKAISHLESFKEIKFKDVQIGNISFNRCYYRFTSVAQTNNEPSEKIELNGRALLLSSDKAVLCLVIKPK